MGLGREELLDLFGSGNPSPGAQGPAIQGRGRIGIGQGFFQATLGGFETCRDEGAAEHIPRTRRIYAIHLKSRRSDKAAVTPGEASLPTERHTDQKSAKFSCDSLDGPAGLLLDGLSAVGR